MSAASRFVSTLLGWHQLSARGVGFRRLAVLGEYVAVFLNSVLSQAPYHDSDSFSTTSFRANTREQSSQRFLSGSIVSLYLNSNVS